MMECFFGTNSAMYRTESRALSSLREREVSQINSTLLASPDWIINFNIEKLLQPLILTCCFQGHTHTHTRALLDMSSIRFSALVLLALCVISTQALYFYLEGSEKKCFIEDLPKETMVIGNECFGIP